MTDEENRLRDYRIQKCEERLDAGARSMAEDRADRDRLKTRALMSVLTSLGAIVVAIVSAAYTVGARNAQMAFTERTVQQLVSHREAQEKERAELIRRLDAIEQKLDVEKAARAGIEELVRAALVTRRGR